MTKVAAIPAANQHLSAAFSTKPQEQAVADHPRAAGGTLPMAHVADAAVSAPPTAEAEPSLHRVMGPWLLLLFIVGDILGTGIYALTGQVAKQVGGVVWLAFVVAFAVALVTGLLATGSSSRSTQGAAAPPLYTTGVRHPLRHLHRSPSR
jgi:hypothetical protein